MDKEDVIVSPDTRRSERIPPGQQQTERWPVLHYGSIPRIDVRDWKLSIEGLVKQECELKYADGFINSSSFCPIR